MLYMGTAGGGLTGSWGGSHCTPLKGICGWARSGPPEVTGGAGEGGLQRVPRGWGTVVGCRVGPREGQGCVGAVGRYLGRYLPTSLGTHPMRLGT